MTPRARSSAPSAASLLTAPRSLNELVTCRFSYLTHTCAPVRAERFGAGSIGVRNTCVPMVRRADWISPSVIVMSHIPRLRTGEAEQPAGSQHEHHDQQREHHDIARRDLEIGRPHGFDERYTQSTEEGTGD